MFEVLYANEKNVVKSISDVFGPMIVELKEGVSKQKHGNLVPSMLAKQVEVVIYDDEYSINRVKVFPADDGPNEREEVILVEGGGKRQSFVFGEAVEVFVDEVEDYLHVEEVMQTGLFADQGKEKVDEVFVAEHGYAGLYEAA